MFKFPGNDGLVYDYQTEQMLNILWSIGLFEMIIFGILVVMLIFRKVVGKKSPPVQQPSTISEAPLIQRQSTLYLGTQYDVFLVVSSILFYILLLLLTLSTGVLHGFEKLGRTLSNKIWYAAIVAVAGVLLHVLWKYFTSDSNRAFVQKINSLKGKKLLLYTIALLLWLTVVGLMFYFMNGVCYCIYNDEFGDTQYSTSFTRRIHLKEKVCPGGSICQIYATLPQTTNTSVFINVHTGKDVLSLISSMTTGNTSISPSDSYFFQPYFIEEFGDRRIWTLLFTDLAPSTLYNLSVDTRQQLVQTTYKTFPKFGDTNTSVKILMGGDVGLTPEGREMFDQMANETADLLVIGGDITYDNAMSYCYYPWDQFYRMVGKISKLNTNSSRLIPFILALGNHDVGYNGLAKQYVSPNTGGPWWYAYNPQHFASDGRSIPQIQQRLSYGYHIIGSTVLVTLDSAYQFSYEHQGQYLQTVSAQFSSQNYALMANYHVPLYPSCFTETPTHGQSKQALELSLKYYEPVFIKYKYKLCLQNHVHKFKRTRPISGVVYIGDGNLGVDAVECPVENRISDQYMEKKMYVDSNHYWVGTMYPNRIELSAKSRHNATQIDATVIPLV